MNLTDNYFNHARLISMGYGDAHANAIYNAQMLLENGTSQLIRCKQGPSEDDETEAVGIAAFTSDDPDELLLHDDILLPWWERFADALSSVTAGDHGYIHLVLNQVQLGKVVSRMLLQSFKTAPLKHLILTTNGLGSDGMEFVVKAVKMNATLEALSIRDNHIESENDAAFLVRTVSKHPKVGTLILEKCGIGQNNAVMTAIVPSLRYMEEVCLNDNCIGSHGAILISSCLASNPGIKFLNLDDNVLNNGDATMLAKSLKTNTKLWNLSLRGNRITQVGINTLSIAVHSTYGLNGISDSNHTCSIDAGVNSVLRYANSTIDPKTNRKVKILSSLGHISYLDDAPVEIMPKVLDLLQGKEFMDTSKYNGLDAVFRFIREWSMPLLYTSYIGPELRRSERTRKKMNMHYMGK